MILVFLSGRSGRAYFDVLLLTILGVDHLVSHRDNSGTRVGRPAGSTEGGFQRAYHAAFPPQGTAKKFPLPKSGRDPD